MQESIKGTVSGRVQGVGFRNFVRHHARALGVAGYARNLPNGDVEVLLQGERDALENLKRFVASGPPGSFVEQIDWQDEAVEATSGFRVG